jgi:hypothetical protein
MQRNQDLVRISVILFVVVIVALFHSFRSVDNFYLGHPLHPLEEVHPGHWYSFTSWLKHQVLLNQHENKEELKLSVGNNVSQIAPTEIHPPPLTVSHPSLNQEPLNNNWESPDDQRPMTSWNSIYKPWWDYDVNQNLMELKYIFLGRKPSLPYPHLRTAPLSSVASANLTTSVPKTIQTMKSIPKDTSASSKLQVTTNPLQQIPSISQDEEDQQLLQLQQCVNQTRCIQPHLLLSQQYKVYLCRHLQHGIRFHFLVREGLLLHPKIRLVTQIDQAEIIIYLPESSPWSKSECSSHQYRSKLIVLDESDSSNLFSAPSSTSSNTNNNIPQETGFLLYFKRSYVHRENGQFLSYMPYLTQHSDVLPMYYPVATAYLRHKLEPLQSRKYELLCSLRSDNTRSRVRSWLTEYTRLRNLDKSRIQLGEVDGASRPVISREYFGSMAQSQIIVTVNPSSWEGDFRLSEALASAALIFVDQMYVPRPRFYVSGEHVIFYDNHNKTAFFALLDHYRQLLLSPTNSTSGLSGSSNPVYGKSEKRLHPIERIALRGYRHAATYHRTENLIDYIFRSLHILQALTQLIEWDDQRTNNNNHNNNHHHNDPYHQLSPRTRALMLLHPHYYHTIRMMTSSQSNNNNNQNANYYYYYPKVNHTEHIAFLFDPIYHPISSPFHHQQNMLTSLFGPSPISYTTHNNHHSDDNSNSVYQYLYDEDGFSLRWKTMRQLQRDKLFKQQQLKKNTKKI